MTWTPLLDLFIAGIPRPGGSKQSMARYGRDGKPIMVGKRVVTYTKEAGKYTPQWRDDVKAAAAREWGERPLIDGPIELTITFYFERPAGHFGTGRNAGVLKASAPEFPAVAPDATKCLRAVEDSLNKVIWRDDSRVVDQHVFKRFGDKPGARITISVPATNGTPAPSRDLFAGVRS